MHPPVPPPSGPAPEPSRGRRGNGLSAGEWGALVDVDPRLSDQLLERLAGEGVAAHVEPAGATTDPVSRAGTMPVRPLERLWVDVTRADAARAVVEAAVDEVVSTLPDAGGIEQFLHAVPRGASGRVLKPPPRLDRSAPAPAVSPQDDDAAWRAIVEGFERSPDSPVPPWPVSEDVDPSAPASPPADEPPASDPAPRRRRRTDTPVDEGLPGWVEPGALPDDGHYVPPPPPPPPRIQPRTLAAIASIVLGVLLLFAPTLLDVAPGGGSYLLGMVMTAGGAGALVYWMRDAPGPDDGPDDGAVV